MTTPFISRRFYNVPLAHGGVLRLGERPLLMGILNVTPDSFAEPKPRLDPDEAVGRALQMEADGADIIDVGGESTRPGADVISTDEELARVLPVIRGLTGRIHVPLSIDTRKTAVATAAIDAGGEIINDVSGPARDPRLLGAVAATGAALVLMHTRGTPKTMYAEARYD